MLAIVAQLLEVHARLLRALATAGEILTAARDPRVDVADVDLLEPLHRACRAGQRVASGAGRPLLSLLDRSLRRRSRRVLRASRLLQHHSTNEAVLLRQAVLGRQCFERAELARPDSVAEALLQPGRRRRVSVRTPA